MISIIIYVKKQNYETTTFRGRTRFASHASDIQRPYCQDKNIVQNQYLTANIYISSTYTLYPPTEYRFNFRGKNRKEKKQKEKPRQI